MDKNHPEPIAELIAKLDEVKKLPKSPEKERLIKEAEALFPAAAEELSILGDTIGVLAEQYQNGTSIKKKEVSPSTSVVVKPTSSEVPPVLLTKSRRETWRGYWDRKKGQVAVGMTLVAALFIYANLKNIKMLDDFIHDEGIVGEFEDWAGIEEEQRETPSDWRERRSDV